MSDQRESRNGLISNFVRWSQERRDRKLVSAEKARVQREARELASFLLKVPREEESVLHEKSRTLSDGVHLHAVLCNTANATSLEDLLAAKHRADRVDVYLTEPTSRSRYAITFRFHDDEIEYSQSQGTVNIVKIFLSGIKGKGYVVYKAGTEVPFDNAIQQGVYGKSADIFHNAGVALQ